jgi:hypothetical protein
VFVLFERRTGSPPMAVGDHTEITVTVLSCLLVTYMRLPSRADRHPRWILADGEDVDDGVGHRFPAGMPAQRCWGN